MGHVSGFVFAVICAIFENENNFNKVLKMVKIIYNCGLRAKHFIQNGQYYFV